MSQHQEWISADCNMSLVAKGWEDDEFDNIDSFALVLEQDELIVITGDLDELNKFADDIKVKVQVARTKAIDEYERASGYAKANGFDSLEAAIAAGRCARHPGFEPHNCPGCGTSG